MKPCLMAWPPTVDLPRTKLPFLATASRASVYWFAVRKYLLPMRVMWTGVVPSVRSIVKTRRSLASFSAV